jgi:hypothetical protein
VCLLLIQFLKSLLRNFGRFYNYSKNVARGVRDFLIEVDGLSLYMGTLVRADRWTLLPSLIRVPYSPTPFIPSIAHALNFFILPTFYRSEKPNPELAFVAPGSGTRSSLRRTRGQSVLFTNDPKIVQVHKEGVRIQIVYPSLLHSCRSRITLFE